MKPKKLPELDPNAAGLGGTWPLVGHAEPPPFPEDPKVNVAPFHPGADRLEALEQNRNLPETTEQAELEQRRLRESVPPAGFEEEWLRAARALIAWLSERVERGTVHPLERATIARTWLAFSLGGTSVPQLLRVAHLVSRAHTAIRETPRGDRELQAALIDCARVLHSGLPTPIRERMPLERALQVVRRLRSEADAWAAMVEGTSELLGWIDYARSHAAATIRTAIEQARTDVPR